MNIKRENLEKAIRFPASVIKSVTLPICECLQIEAVKGRFFAKSSDTNQFCATTTECKGDLAPICVPIHSLTSIVGLFKEDVQIVLDKKVLQIDGGRFHINVLPADDFPKLNKNGLKKMDVPVFQLPAVMENISRFAGDRFEGVHFVGDGKRVMIEASSGVVLARFQKDCKCSVFDIFIPKNFVGSLCELMQDAKAELQLSENFIYVHNGSGHYACKLSETKFPGVKQFLDVPRKVLGVFKPKDWLEVFRSMVSFNNDVSSKEMVKVIVDGGNLANQGKNGETNYPLAGKIKSRPMALNAINFITCLESFGEEEVKLSVSDTEIVFLEAGNQMVFTSQIRQ